MSKLPLDKLKEKIFQKQGRGKITELTNILDMAREFSCLGEILGRDFEIVNPQGKLLYTMRQKPMAIKQLNILMEEFDTLKKIDAEIEAAKWGSKKGPGKGLAPRKPRKR